MSRPARAALSCGWLPAGVDSSTSDESDAEDGGSQAEDTEEDAAVEAEEVRRSPSAPASAASSPGHSSRSGSPNAGSPVADLPDLAPRLVEFGIYNEYLEFRRDYLNWRRGKAKGARSDVLERGSSVLVRAGSPDALEQWYPNPSVFRWRFTFAYWASTTFVMGSMFFTYGAACELLHTGWWTEHAVKEMVHWSYFTGGVLFVMSTYFVYLQLINLNTHVHSETMYLIRFNWEEIRSKAKLDSTIGTLAYFLGAAFFQIGATADLFDYPEAWSLALAGVPNLLGCIGFVVGGVCEISHNKICCGGATPCDPVWWSVCFNNIGSLTFFLGCFPAVCLPFWHGHSRAFWVNLNFFVGSASFLASSILYVVMWESNDFGLTLLRQLNHLSAHGLGKVFLTQNDSGVVIRTERASSPGTPARQGRPAAEEIQPKKSLSVRGAAFLIFYCWSVCCAIFNAVVRKLQHEHALRLYEWRFLVDVLKQLGTVALLFLVLLLHSAVVRVPAAQPYKCMVWSLRLILLFFGVVQTTSLVRWLFFNPDYGVYWEGEPRWPGAIPGEGPQVHVS